MCTLGPASWAREVVEGMYFGGMDIVRVNGAYADIEELRQVARLVRGISSDISLMLDIKGTEVRLNRFPQKEIRFVPGERFIIGSKIEHGIYPVTYPELYRDLNIGDEIILGDGDVKMSVERIEHGQIFAVIISGSVIKEGQGVNVPGVILNNPLVTDRDKEQINFAIEDGWDFVAASFVRNGEDIDNISKLLEKSNVNLIGKIESRSGVNNIDEILQKESLYGIMVARGDLGVEMDIKSLPHTQKYLIRKGLENNKFVITATEMMQSMVHNARPFRAEVTDVANAVYDGTSAVMLSAETSIGKYPIKTVKTMSSIIKEAEIYTG